jgi:hypothetical protein
VPLWPHLVQLSVTVYMALRDYPKQQPAEPFVKNGVNHGRYSIRSASGA